MPFANTAPLRREIEPRPPERPFTIEFWDGSVVASTSGDGPTFSVRSPKALAHALRAPGQLGLGRAYVSGEIEVDDIDAVIRVLGGWQPPSLDGADKRALLKAAAPALGLTPPPAPGASPCPPRAPPPSWGRAAAATARSATPAPSATTTTSPTSSSSSS